MRRCFVDVDKQLKRTTEGLTFSVEEWGVLKNHIAYVDNRCIEIRTQQSMSVFMDVYIQDLLDQVLDEFLEEEDDE